MTDRLEQIERRVAESDHPIGGTDTGRDLLWLLGQVRIAWADADRLAQLFDSNHFYVPTTAYGLLEEHQLAVAQREAL